MNIATKTERIRMLNDALRKAHQGGQVVITAGIHDLGQEKVDQILKKVATFDNFNEDNDPYLEHDGAVQIVEDQKIIWKIDYYDPSLSYLSEDPADPKLTRRVLTVMLAHEY
jgi:Protein of unknown function (DUF3768)